MKRKTRRQDLRVKICSGSDMVDESQSRTFLSWGVYMSDNHCSKEATTLSHVPEKRVTKSAGDGRRVNFNDWVSMSLNLGNKSKSVKEEFYSDKDAPQLDRFDTTLGDVEEYLNPTPKEHDWFGRGAYMRACDESSRRPIGQILRQLEDDEMHMRYYYIDAVDTRAICSSLKENIRVTTLDLADNGLTSKSSILIAKMLEENCFISHLDLSRNLIGSKGLQALKESFENSGTLTHIRMSGCGIKDSDGIALARIIKNNSVMQYLDISHNLLEDDAGTRIAKALEHNDCLFTLNLSWNHLRSKTGRALGPTLQANNHLKNLDLSWNGMSDDGMLTINEALELNLVLEELDLSGTRITPLGATGLARALRKNSSLITLKLNGNMLDATAIALLIDAIRQNTNHNLNHLEINHIIVDKRIKEIVQDIQTDSPDFVLKLHQA